MQRLDGLNRTWVRRTYRLGGHAGSADILARRTYRFGGRTGSADILARRTYRLGGHTGSVDIPARRTYRFGGRTGSADIRVRRTYRLGGHTGSADIPARWTYRFGGHTGSADIPARRTYRLGGHTGSADKSQLADCPAGHPADRPPKQPAMWAAGRLSGWTVSRAACPPRAGMSAEHHVRFNPLSSVQPPPLPKGGAGHSKPAVRG